MIKSILDVLENTAKAYPDKCAFADSKREISYKDFVCESKKIGTKLSELGVMNKPIAIFVDKNVECLLSMMGVLYSGNFYTIIDVKMPMDRINNILSVLKPVAILTEARNVSKTEGMNFDGKLVTVEEAVATTANEKIIDEIKSMVIDTDTMYVLFTSGSTGMPKGTVLTHKAVLIYVAWYKECFNIDENTIFGSQTPFYFSMSVSDVFSTMMSGATLYIVPKMYFSFPIKLLEFLNEKKINTIYWVPSALSIVANLKALDEVELPYLKKVLFAGEVMPTKQLNVWMGHLPTAMFANLYGPTETADICTYYVVNRRFENTASLPIGKACNNCGIILITEDNKEAKQGEEGEVCVRGSFLASGYYDNPEKTNAVFVQNPLNAHYPEIIYKTGDLAKYNEFGELIYISRKDFQIKHMGYRIELGEIETAINSLEGIISCACIYDTKTSQIVLFYQGEIEQDIIIDIAKQKLPTYMRPNRIEKLDRMMYNANGKIDRVYLKGIIN